MWEGVKIDFEHCLFHSQEILDVLGIDTDDSDWVDI